MVWNEVKIAETHSGRESMLFPDIGRALMQVNYDRHNIADWYETLG